MRESRTYGSGRGACHEMHVPTATLVARGAIGTLLPSAEAASCPQLAEGALAEKSGFDRGRVKTRLRERRAC